MSQTATLKEVREQLSELVARVAYGNQKVVITKFGKPLAAIVNYETYEKLMNPASSFTNEEWEKGFEFITKIQDTPKDNSNEEADKIIEKEIRTVRESRHAKSRS